MTRLTCHVLAGGRALTLTLAARAQYSNFSPDSLGI